jgi:gas vesicle protein GvpA/GvpJ/GvpM family
MADERRLPAQRPSPLPGRPEQANLADILERVLDKGIVIAGDIQINLLDIELLTIKLRLLIASVDRAQEMGINWWESDPALSSPARDSDEEDDEEEGGGRKQLEEQNQELRERIERLEQRLGSADQEQTQGQGQGGAASQQAGGGGA